MASHDDGHTGEPTPDPAVGSTADAHGRSLASLDDDGLEGSLRTLLAAVDPVPADLLAQARGLFAWRGVEDDLDALARVSFDSLAGATAGMRSATVEAGTRHLTLDGPAGLVLDLEVEGQGDGARTLRGQLAGVDDVEVVVAVRVGDQVRHTTVDALGTFAIVDVPAGRTRLLIQAGDQPMVTPWLDL